MHSFKNTYQLFLAVVFLLFIGCSQNPASQGTDDVDAFLAKKGVIISNNLDTPIWYFAIEGGLAARTFWIPISGKENRIEAFREKVISYSDIGGFEKGDKIIFYYWTTEDPSAKEVQILNIVIST